MIGYVKGTIISKSAKAFLIQVGGVGYEVFVSLPLLEKTKIGSSLELYCYTYVREDMLHLYGFSDLEEKGFFELLISVSGVGPKSALQTLAIAKISEIKKAILRGDPSLLKKVSGIGTKTAERIVVELKNKLDELPISGEVDLSTSGSGAFDALETLGYSTGEIRDAMRQVPVEIEDDDEIIKQILKILGKNKQ